MALPERRDGDSYQERREIPSNSRIYLYNMNFNRWNLQGIEPMVKRFKGALEQSTGSNVLFLQSENYTEVNAREHESTYRSYGLVYPVLSTILQLQNIEDTPAVLAARKDEIDGMGFRAIEEGLIPLEFVQQYFLHDAL